MGAIWQRCGVLKSYAKVNLGLRIVGKRANGYHELSSFMALVTLYDEIIIEESDRVELSVPGFPELEETNLAAKALSKFKEFYKLTIHKKIPIGAGLGGGSSNAGVILKKYNASSSDALALGSDVPFFLNGALALVEGIGERVTSLDSNLLPKERFLILVPKIQCDTKTVYSNFKGEFSEPYKEFKFNEVPLFGNDLEEAACFSYPELKQYLNRIRDIEPNSQISGSGSSVIVFPKDIATREKLKSLNIPFFEVNFLLET
jgi:4-diphosphocytidyl-2-C-methyl-D-erythritol kinase